MGYDVLEMCNGVYAKLIMELWYLSNMRLYHLALELINCEDIVVIAY